MIRATLTAAAVALILAVSGVSAMVATASPASAAPIMHWQQPA